MDAVLVTGASGHLGANLTRALLAQGRDVRVLTHRTTAGLDGLDVTRTGGDVTDLDSLRRAVAGVKTVYHLAAVVSISGRENPTIGAVNVGGTRNVAAACLEQQVGRLIHFSSSHAFAEPARNPTVDEDSALVEAGGLPYDRSKAAAEREVSAAVEQGLDAVILNPCAVLGPYDFAPSPMGQVLLDLYHRRLPGLVDGGYTWVDARDVARAAIAAEQRGRSGERYLLTGEWRSVAEIAAHAEAATGVPAPSLVTPMWLARAVAPAAAGWARLRGRPGRFTPASLHPLRSKARFNNARARRELGFAPRPAAESVADAYAWFEAQGRLAWPRRDL